MHRCVPASEFCRELDINKAGKLRPKREAWRYIARLSIRYSFKEIMTPTREASCWDKNAAAAVCTRDGLVSLNLFAVLLSFKQINAIESLRRDQD